MKPDAKSHAYNEKTMRLLALICAGSVWLSAQTPEQGSALSPEVLLLSRVRQHMVANLSRQPNYTCVETVERSRRSGAARKFQLQDTLRLEVALVDGKEMFGWPGARKFEDTDLRNMVHQGAFGNGNFALHARAIFRGVAATFEYRGEAALDSRPSVRFDFRVARFMSGYQITIGAKSAIVGFHGSFWADPKSLDLQQLEVIADDIPRELGLDSASDRMQYARTQIGDAEFLLPLASELIMIDLEGQESRNRVRFASCRQFSGESVLTFADAPSETPDGPTAVRPMSVEAVELPRDLSVPLTLLDEIDTASAAVGDPLRANLRSDLKHKGRLLFPKGAVATGRITRLERHEAFTVLGIEFSELASPGLEARLLATLEQVVGAQFTAPPGRNPLPAPAPGEGIIPLRTGHTRVPRGTLMLWRT